MSKKTKLLAGVAMPLLSISLTVQSALAGMPVLSNAVDRSTAPALVVPVQTPAPEPESEELLKRKRPADEPHKGAPDGQPRGQRPEGQPRPEGARPDAQRPEATRPQAEPPRAEPKAEPRPEPKAEPRPQAAEPAPKRAEPPSAPPAAKAAPAERAPDAQKPAVPPAANERPQPPALKAEPPKPEAQKPEAQKPEAQKPEAGKPEAQKPEAPALRNAAPAEPAQKPREAGPAEKGAAPPPAAAPAGKPPAPDAQKPGEPPMPRAGEPGAPKPPAPPAPTAGANAPQPPAAGEPPRLPPANGGPNGAQRPPVAGPEGQRPVAPPPGGAPRPPAPADQTGRPVPPPAPGAPQPAAAAAPQTPEEIERAKRIANNPASAPANAPVVLPVQNGAPVLDSAKDAAAAPPSGGAGVAGQPAGAAPLPPGAPAPQPGQPPVAVQTTAPRTDADAQTFRGAQQAPIRIEPAISERGRRMDRAPEFALPPGFEDRSREQDGRVIIQYNNQVFVRHDDDRRFYDEGYRPQYESLPNDRVREIIERDNGVRIVTIRNRYGDIIQRSRVDRRGDEVVLYYAPELQERGGRDYQWRDPGVDLPPMRLTVPVNEYIIDTTSDPDRDYYRFLEQPPVERVERVYSIDEVRYSARIRDKMRRIDLDTITFATGSADIPMNQASTLRKVADAIKEVLSKNPAETFLIEGHTDAVGADESNLILSDRRAESVARVLTDAFAIPAENMVTQGYGERYLKVRTDGPNQENRRVTIRRITPLVRPVASK